jgi:hypothetical protein
MIILPPAKEVVTSTEIGDTTHDPVNFSGLAVKTTKVTAEYTGEQFDEKNLTDILDKLK